MTENKMFDNPSEIIAQINTLGWLLGQINSEFAVTDDISHGLYCLTNMIGANTASMIDKLKKGRG